MESQDFQLQELVVPEAVGLAIHELDLGVRALQGAGRERVIVVTVLGE